MSFSQQYRIEVEEKLSAVRMVTSRPMFGGVGLYTDGLFFALIAEDRLYFKVDDSNIEDFRSVGSEPFYPYDSPTPMRYWELPRGVLDNVEELSVWMDKAVAVAQKAKVKKQK